MTGLSGLVVPILLSAVIVFVASSIIHMLLPWHHSDYPKLANEDGVRDALRPLAIPPGDYMVPRPSSMEDMRSPAFLEKVEKGPKLVMTVLPGGSMSMTRNLVGWFLYLVVIAAITGLLAAVALPSGAHAHDVFHVTLIAASLGYAAALWQMTIWYNRSIGTTVRSTIDGLIYAAITAGTFSYFWPT